MRREMVDIDGRDPGADGLEHLSAYLDAETEQSGQADGLVVSVGLVNHGEHELPLRNPFELIQFLARDEQGFPLRVPMSPPSLLRGKGRGDNWTLDSALPIVAVHKNEQAAEPSILDTEIFRIGGDEEIRVSFAIDRFSREQGQAEGAFVDVPIIDGVYRVRCIATLIHAEQTQASRILQCDEIEIRFVKKA